MQAVFAVVAATLGKLGLSLLMSLLTESFLKKMIVHSLRTMATWTETPFDDQVARDVAEAWQVD